MKTQYDLHLGDCLKFMPQIETGSVDTIIADWPYGTTACHWDSIIPLDKLWPECKRVIKPNGAIVLFGSQPFTSRLVMNDLDMFRYAWVWEKSLPMGYLNSNRIPLKKHEDILVFYSVAGCYNPQMTKGVPYRSTSGAVGGVIRDKSVGGWTTINNGERYPTSVLKFNSEQSPVHPTQKPVALLEYLIKTYTNPGELVLDNTCGSGTTGEACLRTDRRFIGIEQDPEYYIIARNRLDDVARELRGEWKQVKDNGRLSDLPMFAGIDT